MPSPRCRAGCTGHSGSACATLGAERVQGLLSGERRSLAAPTWALRARAVLKPPSDRGKSATPLQGFLHGALALARKQRLALARPRNCGTGFSCEFWEVLRANSTKFPRVCQRTGGLLARFATACLLTRLLVNAASSSCARDSLAIYTASAASIGVTILRLSRKSSSLASHRTNQ